MGDLCSCIDNNLGKQTCIDLECPESKSSNTIINTESKSDIPTPSPSNPPTTPEVLNMDRKTMQLLMKMDDTLMNTMDTLDLNAVDQEESKEESKESENPKNTDILKIPPSVKTLSTDDTDLSEENERLDIIAKVKSFDELQNVIGKNYDTDGRSESDHSDLGEMDRLEIEKIKSNEKKKKTDYELDPEELHEMKQELLNLTRHASGDKIKQLHQSNQLSEQILFAKIALSDDGDMGMDIESDLDLPDSNLFRDASEANWNKTSIDKTKKEMTRQMLELASQNRTFHSD